MDEATLAQVRSADPQRSTWVSANAGSGKTRVLTYRVARLLLQGTNPQKILCLTYTKAAASEMQNRLFKELGAWAMMSDDDLSQTLTGLSEETPDVSPTALAQARCLFAMALETPGGLKIQTIHSFCDTLLRRFPLEAGVSPQFKVIETRQGKQLRAEVFEHVATHHSNVFSQFAGYFTAADPDELLQEIIGQQAHFDAPPTRRSFGLASEPVTQDLLSGFAEILRDLVPLMMQGNGTDQKNATVFAQCLADTEAVRPPQRLEIVFLTKSFPIKILKNPVPSKPLRTSHGFADDILQGLAERVQDAREQRVARLAYDKACALYDFATVFLHSYASRKSTQGLLDFDDLVLRTIQLLTGSEMAQWVLYRLDGGIDHVLVDEAQDTSPGQWSVITALAREATSGSGARSISRTVFAVGDEKQSIYSFQGAEPAAFSRMKDHFSTQLSASPTPLQKRQLLHSFRSAAPILQLVDQVFHSGSDLGVADAVQHLAFDTQAPGRVELWPFLSAEAETPETQWFNPEPYLTQDDQVRRLANQLAVYIKNLIDTRQILPGTCDKRVVRPGDFLILVQRRSRLFREIISELKQAGLPIAGADRLDISAELAVQDILSLLRFLVTPEDDLSLAEALRSPLIGIGEAALFELAHGRGKRSLWQSLRANKALYPRAYNMLSELLKQPDYLRPYELIELILIDYAGRQNLLARLGFEAEDAIDELLAQALNFETVQAPTLTGFLQWFDAGKVQIKREMDSGTDYIRVMTVHGAKGLEAPIVILPDTGNRRPPNPKEIVKLADGSLGWKLPADSAPAEQVLSQNIRKEFEEHERLRLLYVALTRAETWLIICGAGTPPKAPDDWYLRIETAMQGLATEAENQKPGIEVTVFQNHPLPKALGQQPPPTESADKSLPAWAQTQAPTPPRPEVVLSPSDLGGAKALVADELSGPDAREAMQLGSLVHLLLEHMPDHPQEDWAKTASAILEGFDPDLSEDMFHEAFRQAKNVLISPELQHLFGANTLAEVDVSARLPELENRRVSGCIDRLVLGEKSVLIVDYKSNQQVPENEGDVPDGYLRQMAAYLGAVHQIYPEHRIDLAILWTKPAQLMPLSHDIVRNALQSAATS